ncbi:type II restriction endonuclease [Helicobacter cetorum]|uniref:type II restriction endonuclease n=1 Tax=Helicobacter cetorum TaxID=138563 RepID=UPI001F410AF9|nr:type II restriction endonuclease [Helicobacter cetorum]
MKLDITFNDFIDSLCESIFSWDYFSDFNKAKQNIKTIEKELNLLNYLLNKSNIEQEFIDLIKEYPNIRKALPLLIATRLEKLKESPIVSNLKTLIAENKEYLFVNDLNDSILDELLVFFKESGLKSIFKNKEIKNLVDYCFGVEVGLDSNARKNRTGFLMEKIVSQFLEQFCRENPHFSYIGQATQKNIKENFSYDILIDKNNRRFDFALLNQAKHKLFLIEVNYYSSGGSKLKATAGEYQYLNDFIINQGIDFIWITDGKGWLTALNPLQETFNHNQYLLNLDMLRQGFLNKIL